MADQVKEALAGASNEGRKTSDRDGTKFSSPSASPASGKVVSKNAGKGVDPASQPKGVRSPVMAERMGASYTVVTNISKPNSPESAQTLANAKVLPAVTHRERNFQSGVDLAEKY